MPSVLWTERAEADLLEIWLYIADDNITAADRILQEIHRTSEMLAFSPFSGRMRDEIAHSLRSMIVGSYVVFYKPIDTGILVIRVLHGARDIGNIFHLLCHIDVGHETAAFARGWPFFCLRNLPSGN